MRRLASAALVAVCLFAAAVTGAAAGSPQKGVNYLTGEGMDLLNCDANNLPQIALDMAQIQALGAAWVRVEVSPTALSGLSKHPTCPKPASQFTGLTNELAGIASIGAQPIVNILSWEYTPAMSAGYIAWLNQLMAAAPGVTVFEIGDEENLSYKVQSYPGANPNEEPYGWNFLKSDFGVRDGIGKCPTAPAKLADLTAGVTSYVAFLTDSYNTIKAKLPGTASTVIIGGLSSWAPDCWLTMLGQMGAYNFADAIGYHPYPRNVATPQDAAATLADVQAAAASWPKQLPIWLTEFGFSSNANEGGVGSEATKAAYLATEFALIAPQVTGPVVWYTARDYPLTPAEWASQCPSNDCPGGVGGFGLFEWDNGTLIVEPAAAAFGGL